MKLQCTNGCTPDTDTPFFYSGNCSDTEIGVLANHQGEATNRFTDGTAGVPQEALDNLEAHDFDCLHCVLCADLVEVKKAKETEND